MFVFVVQRQGHCIARSSFGFDLVGVKIFNKQYKFFLVLGGTKGKNLNR